MFTKLASDPDYIDKLSVFIALAPVASVKNLEIPLIGVMTNPLFMKALKTLGIHEFLPAMKSNIIYHVCDLVKIGCADILGIFADMKVHHDNI